MASSTQWRWVWVNSGSWWWTGRPGVLQSMGHKELDTAEQLNWTEGLPGDSVVKNPPAIIGMWVRSLCMFCGFWLFVIPWAITSPGCSVHGIFQAGILDWVAISSSRGSSQPKDWTQVSYVSALAGRFFNNCTIDHLEKQMATHYSILAWEIPRTEKLCGLQSMALQKS